MKQREYRPQIFAHRGASEQFAEHTRAAYLQALADGADGVECDVHLSADERIILLHDSTIDRTSNGSGAVAQYTLEQLRELDFCSWKGAEIPQEYGSIAQQLLTLEELLDLLSTAGRPIRLALELKHPSPMGLILEERVLSLLMSRGWDPETSQVGNVTIGFMSFDPDAIGYLAETIPEHHLCMLVDRIDAQEVRQSTDYGPLATTAVLSILRRATAQAERLLAGHQAGVAGPGVDYVLANQNTVAQWMKAGLTLRVWTVDEPGHIELMRQLCVQEITTNRPADVRKHLQLCG